ncbi:importin subunit alpha-2, putative [Entamoeba invadens IP1]|uniref:Importin subunit alpha-2, putative n=1 Tax=Entamoeba invadens IP1 TaxID=370355 RepID=A0A0A1U7I3_ENTIV|nr:importin subunit alpha-2, putative [Entamoeba invadens IP1]ELP90299.1 importin subunit alpha-2, putative [Entamoeba invadens IP1]|eukprot:XP_004257070.1 importin subunit alpha-2, putative [Entamoeba invadens IP1]
MATNRGEQPSLHQLAKNRSDGISILRSSRRTELMNKFRPIDCPIDSSLTLSKEEPHSHTEHSYPDTVEKAIRGDTSALLAIQTYFDSTLYFHYYFMQHNCCSSFLKQLATQPDSYCVAVLNAFLSYTSSSEKIFSDDLVKSGFFQRTEYLLSHGEDISRRTLFVLGNLLSESKEDADCFVASNLCDKTFDLLRQYPSPQFLAAVVFLFKSLIRGNPDFNRKTLERIVAFFIGVLDGKCFSNDIENDVLWGFSFLSDNENNKILFDRNVIERMYVYFEKGNKCPESVMRFFGNLVRQTDDVPTFMITHNCFKIFEIMLAERPGDIRAKNAFWTLSNLVPSLSKENAYALLKTTKLFQLSCTIVITKDYYSNVLIDVWYFIGNIVYYADMDYTKYVVALQPNILVVVLMFLKAPIGEQTLTSIYLKCLANLLKLYQINAPNFDECVEELGIADLLDTLSVCEIFSFL